MRGRRAVCAPHGRAARSGDGEGARRPGAPAVRRYLRRLRLARARCTKMITSAVKARTSVDGSGIPAMFAQSRKAPTGRSRGCGRPCVSHKHLPYQNYKRLQIMGLLMHLRRTCRNVNKFDTPMTAAWQKAPCHSGVGAPSQAPGGCLRARHGGRAKLVKCDSRLHRNTHAEHRYVVETGNRAARAQGNPRISRTCTQGDRPAPARHRRAQAPGRGPRAAPQARRPSCGAGGFEHDCPGIGQGLPLRRQGAALAAQAPRAVRRAIRRLGRCQCPIRLQLGA